MSKVKITLIKSAIGYPKNQKSTLQALGLNKMNRSKVVEPSAAVQGMIDTVKHLLKIEKAD